MVTEILRRFAEQSSVKCDFKPAFDKYFKKVKNQVLLDKVVREMKRICENPYIGKKKHGKLKDVYGHKFYHVRTQYIISFKIIKVRNEMQKRIEFVEVNDHGDDYKSVERYVSTSKRS